MENNVTAIIGPSGCGKSTYIKALNRMVELVPSVKTAGKILYRDQIYLMQSILKKSYVLTLEWSFNNLTHSLSQFMIILLMALRLTVLKTKILDEIVEKSLRGAAIWDELKIDCIQMLMDYQVDNNNVFV